MGAPLGFKTFATGDVLTAADTNGYLMQGVWTFANAAARSAAVTSPQEGNMSFLKDTNSTEYYSGSAWVAVAGTSSSGLTFLNRTTFSATAQANVDSVFTSTYKAYLVVIENLTAGTGADNAQLVMRRGSTSSTTAIYGASVGASYNTTPANLGTTNAAQFEMNEYCDGLSATLWFNNVGTGSSVAARVNGTYVAPSTGNAGTLGFTIADLQNWNGFGLKSSSSTVTGAVTTYGLAQS